MSMINKEVSAFRTYAFHENDFKFVSKEDILGKWSVLEGVPDLLVAPQDEAGLTTTFQMWPRGCFHIAKHPDFPVPTW